MEFNAEINKVFGQEMAKLFAATISQEEMEQQAQKVWRELNTSTSTWNRRSDSQLEEYIKNEFLTALHEEIKKVLAKPDNKEELEKRAREMVAEARRIGEEAIIKSMANNLVSSTLSVYNIHDKFVQDVMEVLRLRDNSLR